MNVFIVIQELKMPHRLRKDLNTEDAGNHLSDDGIPRAASQSLLDELDAVIADRGAGSRADVLRRITDLFVTGSGTYTDGQRDLFDEIMGRLVKQIDSSARSVFGKRLVTIACAPPKVSCALALDDSIEVAGPLLTHSDQLDDNTLITSAKTKGDQHLLAISRRKTLSASVTDVLVERGSQPVVVSTAGNSGAQFSEFGYSTLVTRSENDPELALTVWLRPEVPREHLLTLFEAASEAVQLQLTSADRSKAALIRGMVKEAADKIQEHVREHSPEFVAAQTKLQSLYQVGALTEDRLREFAEAAQFAETTVALSLLGKFPLGAVERALIHDKSDHLLLLAKSIGLSWGTTKAILTVRARTKGQLVDESDECARFNRFNPEAARAAVRFYWLRERAAKGSLLKAAPL